MSEWQPIETAPKDGTLILGFDQRYRDTTPHAQAYYGCDEDGYRVSPIEVVCWLESQRNVWVIVDRDTKKRETADWSHWARSQGAWSPTHWQPLPLPPLPAHGVDGVLGDG